MKNEWNEWKTADTRGHTAERNNCRRNKSGNMQSSCDQIKGKSVVKNLVLCFILKVLPVSQSVDVLCVYVSVWVCVICHNRMLNFYIISYVFSFGWPVSLLPNNPYNSLLFPLMLQKGSTPEKLCIASKCDRLMDKSKPTIHPSTSLCMLKHPYLKVVLYALFCLGI